MPKNIILMLVGMGELLATFLIYLLYKFIKKTDDDFYKNAISLEGTIIEYYTEREVGGGRAFNVRMSVVIDEKEAVISCSSAYLDEKENPVGSKVDIYYYKKELDKDSYRAEVKQAEYEILKKEKYTFIFFLICGGGFFIASIIYLGYGIYSSII